MILADLNFSLLSADTDISSFDCGDKDLNDFFLNDALLYKQELLAVTYCFEDDKGNVAGFFSVSNDSLIDRDFEKWNI